MQYNIYYLLNVQVDPSKNANTCTHFYEVFGLFTVTPGCS